MAEASPGALSSRLHRVTGFPPCSLQPSTSFTRWSEIHPGSVHVEHLGSLFSVWLSGLMPKMSAWSLKRPCHLLVEENTRSSCIWVSSPGKLFCSLSNRVIHIVVVQLLSCVWLCNPIDCSTPGFPVLHYLLEFAQTRPLNQCCYPTISSSVTPFCCLQCLPASESFPMTLLFTSGGHSIRASASVLPLNTQGWFPLGLTGFIYLLSKGFSSVFSNTTVQKHKFFGAQLSLWSNSHIHTWLLEKP